MLDYEYEITEYINNENHNGALLLTGKWGSGKSYFIKQLAEKINDQKQYLVIIVSLFGVTSSAQINLAIKEQLLNSLLHKDEAKVSDFLEKGTKIAKSISSVLKDVNGAFKGINTALNINIYDFFEISKSVPFKSNKPEKHRELVLVFDDFERHDSCMDSTELLGCINQFVENESISTIIVADESKINDSIYDEFKEKVIERTVHYEPDAEIIIKSILNSFLNSNDSYSEFIKDNEKDIIDTFLDSKTNNFRSFKSTIIYFERIFIICKELDVPSVTIAELFLTFSCLVYEIKSNRFVSTDRYGNVFINLNSNIYYKESYDSYLTNQSEKDQAKTIESVNYSKYNAIYRLSYLQNWLLSGKWDKDGLINEIAMRFLPSDEHPIDFLYARVLDLNDCIVEEQLPIVLQKAYSGELTREQYILLLSKIANLISINCSVPLNVDYDKLDEGWTIHESIIKDNPSLEKMGHYYISPEVLTYLMKRGMRFITKW